MANFTLRRQSVEEIRDYKVLITEFENGVEQRRLKHDKTLVGFKITSPILNKTTLKEYIDFFDTEQGALGVFTFTSPFDDETYNVRFEPGSFRTTFSTGVYQCSFDFKIVL